MVNEGGNELYSICEKMPVMATINIKQKEIYNIMDFVIEKIEHVNEQCKFLIIDNEQLTEEF